MASSTSNDRMPATKTPPGKVSEMMLAFAQPLFDVTGPPRNIDDLRKAFALVTLCWNLPTLERQQDPQATALREHFDSVVGAFPEPLSTALLDLIGSRTTEFGEVPFLVLVEIRGTSLDDCTVYAEARGAG